MKADCSGMKDLQMILMVVKSHRRKFRQDPSFFPLAKLVVIQWPWLLMLKFSWGIRSQAQKMFLGPSQLKRTKRSDICHWDFAEGAAEVCQLRAQIGELNMYQPAVWEQQGSSFLFQISPCSTVITREPLSHPESSSLPHPPWVAISWPLIFKKW